MLVSVPAVLPGAEAYVDNAPHLVELQALARDVLPHRITGWTDAAEHGFAVGEINGPLAWMPVALAVRAGMNPIHVWALASVVANVVFALGTYALGSRLWAEERAATIGAILAVTAVPGLYGIGGAMGGMWPWRLALGVVALGLGAPSERSTARNALWISTTLLLHLYAGVLACGWALATAICCFVGDNRRGALAWAVGTVTALTVTAFFWAPLLDTHTRGVGRQHLLDPLWVYVYTILPIEPFVEPQSTLPRLEAGGWGLVGAALVLGGLVLCARSGLRPRGPSAGLVAGGAVAIVTLVALVGLTDATHLGPNPWRFVAIAHLVLACLAGAGFAAVGAQRIVGGAVVLAALAAGVHELPRKTERSPWADLEATWADLAAAAPPGWVFHEDPMFDEDAPPWFQRSHVGALLTLRTGLPTVGSWYGITPILTAKWTASKGLATLRGWPGGGSRWPNEFYERLRRLRVGSIVAVSPTLARMFAHDPRYVAVTAHGPFTAWRVAEGVLPDGPTADGMWSRGKGRIPLDVSGPFEIARTWHPGWTATLDEAPVDLAPSPSTGFITGTAAHPGVVHLVWRPAAGIVWLSLAAVVGIVGLAGLPRAPASAAPRWTTGRWFLVGVVVHAVLWVALVEPGTHQLDEIGYRLAARALTVGTGLDIRVGAEGLPLGPLQALVPGYSAQVTEHGGRLVCQYPPGGAVLAAPLYAVFGYLGLFLLNGVALVACVWLTARLAARWDAPPLLAIALLLFGSYFWEYSVAAIPHHTALALVLAAMVVGAQEPSRWSAWGAGLLAAGALSVRLDILLLLPVVAVILWSAGSTRALVRAALGGIPVMAALAAANAWRFGTWNPLSYGVDTREGVVANTSGFGPHLPIVALGLVLGVGWAGAVHAAGRLRVAALLLTLAGVAGVVVVAGPGLATIGLDMRLRPIPEPGPAITLLADGTVLNLGQAKKALLQSCPWLIVLALAVPALIREGPAAFARRPGWLAILVPLGFYSAPAWDGGLALHMRYLLPVLPFAAIELAHLWRRHPALADFTPRAVAMGALVGAGAGFFVAHLPDVRPGTVAPGVLTGASLVITITVATAGAALVKVARLASWLPAATALAVGWSGAIAVGVDLAHHQRARADHAAIGDAVSDYVPPGSVVIGPIPDPLASLYERGDVVVGSVIADGGAGFPSLVAAALAQGRPVYILAEAPGVRSPFPTRPPADLVATIPPYRLLKVRPP